MASRARHWEYELEAEFGHRDITDDVKQLVADSGIRTGTVSLGMVGSTGGITTIEYESGALQDLHRAVEMLAPAGEAYAHNARWGDGNGFSHIRSALLKTGLSIPVVDGQLQLGTWQQVTVLNFDNRSRRRKVVGVVTGE